MININRHNYEEFFLLYTDRELSPAERVAVEQFVQENPDLADEFLALQQTTLPVEENLITDKSLLYRNAGEEIGLHNHTEQFLLYVDDELVPEEREAVERFVLQHPALQEEFVQFKQTKLPVEELVFPYKNSLYRTESERKPIVYMRWMKMVAAAAIIGFGFFLWTITGNTGSTISNDNQLATVTDKKIVGTDNTNSSSVVNEPAEITDNSSGSYTSNKVNKIAQQNTVSVLQQSLAVNVPITNTSEDLKTKPELIIERQNTITAEESVKPLMNTKTFAGIAANEAINVNEMIKTAASPDETEAPEKEALVQQVVYRELDTETNSNNKSLLIGSVEINKDKLRGLFRKATSIFRSKKAEEAETVGTGPSRPLK
jgi:anti-sigma factor RsiW